MYIFSDLRILKNKYQYGILQKARRQLISLPCYEIIYFQLQEEIQYLRFKNIFLLEMNSY